MLFLVCIRTVTTVESMSKKFFRLDLCFHVVANYILCCLNSYRIFIFKFFQASAPNWEISKKKLHWFIFNSDFTEERREPSVGGGSHLKRSNTHFSSCKANLALGKLFLFQAMVSSTNQLDWIISKANQIVYFFDSNSTF